MSRVKQTYIVFLIVISLFSLAIYSTYAMFTSEINTNNIVNIDTTLSLSTNVNEYQIVSVPKMSYKTIDIKVTNGEENTLYYGVWYEVNGDMENVRVYKVSDSVSNTIDSIESNENKKISIAIINNSSSKAVIKMGVITSLDSNLDIDKNVISDTIEKNMIGLDSASKYLKNNVGEEKKFTYKEIDSDNYVILNDEMWRIINVNDKVIMIKSDSIGEYSNIDDNINLVLNSYMYSEDMKCYKNNELIDCSFKDIGLNNYIDYIDEVRLLSKEEYDSTTNGEDSWMSSYNTIINDKFKEEDNNYNYYLEDGKIDYNKVKLEFNVVPVIILKEDVKIVGGNGSFDNPYKLGL